MTYGAHYVKAWAPDMKELIDTFFVDEKVNLYRKQLFFSDNYKQYKNEVKIFKNKKSTRKLVKYSLIGTSIFSFGALSNSYINYKSEKKYSKKELLTAKEAFEGYKNAETVKELNNYLIEYNESYDKYTQSIKSQNKIIRNINISGSYFLLTTTTFLITNFYNKAKKIVHPKKPKMTIVGGSFRFLRLFIFFIFFRFF